MEESAWEGGETDEGEEETERCGQEVKRMKKRNDQGSLRCRAGGFQTSHLCFYGNATEIIFN